MYFERADSWQLLLQIDGDEEMNWWDDGRMYVCIRRRDLSERRFERWWTLMQCT
jgi:uncharacterized protein YwqG